MRARTVCLDIILCRKEVRITLEKLNGLNLVDTAPTIR